jgi:hypothetical protein
MTTNLQVFATKTFARWMRKNKVSQEDLLVATQEMVNGLIDADLGGYVVKKRLALHGRGKSSGARTIVATKFGVRCFFLFGFEKNEISNIDRDELKALKHLALTLLSFEASHLATAVSVGQLIELKGEA